MRKPNAQFVYVSYFFQVVAVYGLGWVEVVPIHKPFGVDYIPPILLKLLDRSLISVLV